MQSPSRLLCCLSSMTAHKALSLRFTSRLCSLTHHRPNRRTLRPSPSTWRVPVACRWLLTHPTRTSLFWTGSECRLTLPPLPRLAPCPPVSLRAASRSPRRANPGMSFLSLSRHHVAPLAACIRFAPLAWSTTVLKILAFEHKPYEHRAYTTLWGCSNSQGDGQANMERTLRSALREDDPVVALRESVSAPLAGEPRSSRVLRVITSKENNAPTSAQTPFVLALCSIIIGLKYSLRLCTRVDVCRSQKSKNTSRHAQR